MRQRETEIQIAEGAEHFIREPAVEASIGYLSMWAICGDTPRYAGKCTIHLAQSGDISAVYRNADGALTYSIFGQRGEAGEYSFHS